MYMLFNGYECHYKGGKQFNLKDKETGALVVLDTPNKKCHVKIDDKVTHFEISTVSEFCNILTNARNSARELNSLTNN